MSFRAILLASLLVLAVVAGTGAVASPGESQACEAGETGRNTSIANSDGTSLENAGPGIQRAFAAVGCTS